MTAHQLHFLFLGSPVLVAPIDADVVDAGQDPRHPRLAVLALVLDFLPENVSLCPQAVLLPDSSSKSIDWQYQFLICRRKYYIVVIIVLIHKNQNLNAKNQHLLFHKVLLRSDDGPWSADPYPSYGLCSRQVVMLHHVAANQSASSPETSYT